MRHKPFFPGMVISITLCFAPAGEAVSGDLLNGHEVVLDRSGMIIPRHSGGYDFILRRCWHFLANEVPLEKNELKTYLSFSTFSPGPPYLGTEGLFNPAGLYAAFVDSLAMYYRYSGDKRSVAMIRSMLDRQIRCGTTPPEWEWGGVPFSSSRNGDIVYRGDGDSERDGPFGLQPDKVGELGTAYLLFYRMTGEPKYGEAAVRCADALARHVRKGTSTTSPWPFRVDARTGQVREEYTANLMGPVRLFHELIRLGLANVTAYRRARDVAWSWFTSEAGPMKTNVWTGYFEDARRDPRRENLNHYIPLEAARFILQHPEYDSDWRQDVPRLIAWVKNRFRDSEYSRWGATAIDEQTTRLIPGGSHTARYAAVNAMWYRATGDESYREEAYRSFNWATYLMTGEEGVVLSSPNADNASFSSGYADYMRHFLIGLTAVPEWAPDGENHMLHSTAVIQDISYDQKGIVYRTDEAQSIEILRLNARPATVSVNGNPLPQHKDDESPGWTWKPMSKGGLLRVRKDSGRRIELIFPSL